MEERIKRIPPGDQMNHSNAGNWSRKNSKSKVSNKDNQQDSNPRQHGYSSVQHPRRMRDVYVDPSQKRATFSGQTSKPRSEAASHHKKIIRRSSDGYRGTRPSPESTERPKSFEVTLSDFPELGNATLSDSVTSFRQEPSTCWGPNAVRSNPSSATEDVSETEGRKIRSYQPMSSSKEHDKLSTTTKEYTLPSPYIGPLASSWANIASQPPKPVTLKSPTVTNASSQEDPSAQVDSNSEKKKKKKKKKKSKLPHEEITEEMPNEHFIVQEPPKFEDEEEFPDLCQSFVSPPRGQGHSLSVTAQENKGEGSALEVKNKNKSSSAGSADSKKTQTSQKKSKAPVQLDLGNMLEVLEKKQQSHKSKQDIKPVTFSVGGALPVVAKELSVQKKHPRQQERIAHNPLDSTSPLVKKGKQREVPKAKKPTALKRVILKEREERKQNRLLQERGQAPVSSEGNNPEEPEDQNPYKTGLSEQSQPEPADESSDCIATEDSAGDEPEIQNAEDIMKQNTPSNHNLNRPKIHSRKFRDYCNQVLSKDVDECVTSLLRELVRFQDRLYQKDPMKARMKRRLVMGLREVLKHLKLKKVKCVIISPNCERIQSKGGLDEALHTIIDTCREQGVPFVFALSRKALGRCVSKAVPVSLVGIFNYDGAQDYYHKMIELSSEARKAYEDMIANLEEPEETESPDLEQSVKPTPDLSEEPEYIKIWKKMLEKECNHQFLNFEEQFTKITVNSDSEAPFEDDEQR
ncbi:selenocysteine insertion sequence-binding protein 2 isoform X2 [Chanos chanos]|uniref:Selenocysteine insertion sequence-binding protein 2 isoform X2 n=1 Tax=Chanos chanos TaxID=29144 RepID=A0A6J2WT40_CHACN|nr:selenocysteine insertion sequence-binding protein 2 isoform X2 [Chanos chanos]